MTEKEPENVQPKKIGVYLCRCGGNISDVVDLQLSPIC